MVTGPALNDSELLQSIAKAIDAGDLIRASALAGTALARENHPLAYKARGMRLDELGNTMMRSRISWRRDNSVRMTR